MAAAQSDDRFCGKRALQSLFIWCLGKHNEMKHYTAFGLPRSQPGMVDVSTNLYKLIVDERIEQVTVTKHDSEDIILQSSGGLFNPAERMTFSDPVKNFITGTLDNCRIDFTIFETPSKSIIWYWNFNEIPGTGDMEKKIWVSNQRKTTILCDILGIHQSTTVKAKVGSQYLHENKTPQLIILLASLKYYYGVQQYHQHPVPAGILGLMNRGMPCFPSLSILDNMGQVRIRKSCMNPGGRHWLDILDANTNEILLVVSDNSGGVIDSQFRDTYGIVQFVVNLSQGSNLYIVQDHENSIIGSICLRTKTVSARNDTDSRIAVAKVDRTIAQQTRKHVFEHICHTKTSTSVIAEFYREIENNNIVVNMSKDLDVHKKALALAHAMGTAALFYKIYTKEMLPIFPGYSYRQH